MGTGSENKPQPAVDVMSGTMLRTDQQEEDTSERIKNFVKENFNIEDIRELELRPEDDISDDDGDEDQFKRNHMKISDLYDI